MNARSWLASLCVLASPALLGAELVKDINTTVAPVSSYPQHQGRIQSVDIAPGKLLVMNDGAHGDELWIIDGTAGGSRMVRDIWPGPDSSNIESLTLLAGIAYFWADDGVNGNELWRSDGTAAGTRIVVNIGAGATGAAGDYLPGRSLVAAGSALYFAARDDAGVELWRSNGTAAGTYRVKDINPGASESQIQQIFASGSRIFFGATDSGGFEPWTSDGSTAGTVRIADLRAGTEGSGAYFHATAGGAVFFTADDGAHGSELWRVNADGTGAAIVADLNTSADSGAPVSYGSRPHGIFAVGTSVVFTAVTGSPSAETNNLYSAGATGGVTLLGAAPAGAAPSSVLTIGNRATFRLTENGNAQFPYWVTDGTVAGTARLTISQGNSFFNGESASAVGNGEAFFCAPSQFSGCDIWRTDGTVAGTRVYLTASIPGANIQLLAYYAGRVYFPKEDFSGTTGTELWSTDGTAGGLRMLADINPGGEDSNPNPIGVIGGRLLFFATDGATGFEPWSTDGTAAGTARIGNFAPEITTRNSNPTMLGELGAAVVFSADDEVNGRELWSSDGTAAGTRLVKDIYPGAFESHITNAYLLGGALVFGAEDSAGLELWRSDGTTAGTYRLSDIYPGASPGLPGNYLSGATLNGYFYFIAQDAGNYRDLWRTDGTPSGTAMVADIGAGFDSIEIIGTTGSRLLLLRRPSGQSDGVVWSTDGTPGGTFEVANNVFVYSTQSALFNGRRCFAARETGTYEIYCSNGTANDMVRVTNLTGINAVASGMPHAVNGTLLVPGYFTGVGSSVFATDGTPASTSVFSAGTMMSYADVPFGGGIVYQGFDNGTLTLMYTDGTVAGTRPFLPAGANVAPTNQPVLFDGNIIFVAIDAQGAGPVLWRSDGTAAGTRYLTDIDPGTDGSSPPADFVAHAGKLFFAGMRTGVGRELWTLSPVDPNASDDVLRTSNATVSVVAVLHNDADFDGTLNASSVQIVTPPVSGTTIIDNITGAITYTPNEGFSGADVLAYRVSDNNGRQSNLAYLSIVVASPAGSAPGTAPAQTPAPTPTPTPPAPPGIPPNSGGGGGAIGVEVLLLALLLVPRRRAAWGRGRR